MRSTQSRTTRPLRSTPVTGASPLLRVGLPAEPTSVLDPSQCHLLGALPLAHRQAAGSIGTCLLLLHVEATDRARVAYMPDATWPIDGHLSDSSRSSSGVALATGQLSSRQDQSLCINGCSVVPRAVYCVVTSPCGGRPTPTHAGFLAQRGHESLGATINARSPPSPAATHTPGRPHDRPAPPLDLLLGRAPATPRLGPGEQRVLTAVARHRLKPPPPARTNPSKRLPDGGQSPLPCWAFRLERRERRCTPGASVRSRGGTRTRRSCRGVRGRLAGPSGEPIANRPSATGVRGRDPAGRRRGVVMGGTPTPPRQPGGVGHPRGGRRVFGKAAPRRREGRPAFSGQSSDCQFVRRVATPRTWRVLRCGGR
jgi:hypothetical protein